MNCTSISNVLQSIDPNMTYQLWGLAAKTNLMYCDWDAMLGRLVFLEDFQPLLTNPLYQSQMMQQQLDEIFYPVCYAYSLFRIFMVCVVFVYVKKKLQDIFGEMLGSDEQYIYIVPTFENNQEIESLSNVNSRESARQIPSQRLYRKIKISSQKQQEINIYKYTIYIAIIMELICALVKLLSNLILKERFYTFQRHVALYQYYGRSDFYADNFTCKSTSLIEATWRPFDYSRSLCNCLYKHPKQYIDATSHQGNYMGFSIDLWIVSESCTIGITAFTILTLSRINRKESAGWPFIRPTLFKSLTITLLSITLYSLLIYSFQLPIYYRFYNQTVVVFYFFWKFAGFILIFDRLYNKIWLEWKLRFQSLHSHGIEWNENMQRLKKKILKKYGERINLIKSNIKDKQLFDQFENFMDSKHYELKSLYEQSVNRYFQDSINPFIQKAEKEANAKLKTKWYDYLNYMLLMNLIGLLGFAFLVIYGFSQGSNNRPIYFWIGFILATIELIVFEITNVVFKLHGFFIELYKNIKLEEEQKDAETYIEDLDQSALRANNEFKASQVS